MKKILTIGATALAVTLIACGSGAASDDDKNKLDQRADSDSAPAAPTKSTIYRIEAGTWKVGKKDDLAKGIISPGNYVVLTPESGILCTWSRVKNFDGEIGSVIAINNLSPGTSGIVTVKASDKGLILEGDCLARKEKK